jgi:Fe2+ or Zn2+ uptake regulation protein
MSYADQLRAELVEVLAAAGGPTTTRAARIAITEQRRGAGRAVVAEDIYRALLTLQRRGVVRRVNGQPGQHAHWELTHHRRNADPVGGSPDEP